MLCVRHRRYAAPAATLFLTLMFATPALSATVEAGSGLLAVRTDTDTGSATWRFTNPTAADTISWSSGPNLTDRTLHAQNAFGPEPKFAFPVGGGPAGRAFVGFADNDGPGQLGSRTSTSGTGGSALVPGTLWGTNATANWSITATGTLGVAGVIGGRRAHPVWESRATADDPFNIFASDLETLGIVGDGIDIFFALGIEAGSFSPRGGIEIGSSYVDTNGFRSILGIAMDATGVEVVGDPAARFYRLGSLSEGPTEDPLALLTLEEIQDLLESDLTDLALDTPFYLGIVLEDVALPTNSLPNGALAQVQVESLVRDADEGALPEPAGILLIATGVSGLLLLQRKRHA